MAILWCGGEDVDFAAGGAVIVRTGDGGYRTTYARCAIQGNTVYAQSKAFPGGAVTSCWLSCRVHPISFTHQGTEMVGLVSSGGTPAAGLWVGSSSASSEKLALSTFDGTNRVQLAAEAGYTLANNVTNRIDVQLVSYGATATVYVYCNGTLVITFSGNVTIGGLTDVDSVGLGGFISGSDGWFDISEVIVASEDVRAFPGLRTLALTGAGTTDDWTGAYSDINATTISDASPVYVNVTAKDEEFNWTDLPTGTFIIKAVKIAARMAKSATPAVTQVKLGYNSGGSVAFGTGATKTLTTAYATYEQLDNVNPVTAAAFIQADMNALQVDAQSLT